MLQYTSIFISFSTDLLNETYHFYNHVLELETEIVKQRFVHVYLPNGEPCVIYFKKDHSPATYTVLNFQVIDIAKAVKHLTTKGVQFLPYSEPIKTDAQGISWDDNGSHLAWFKDPGGNIIALIEN
ncbi:MAG: VOC family protein [Bacteroidota bacterium]